MKENLRILFVTSEHPDFLYNGLGTFTRDYVCELKKYCDVFCVYFHLSGGIKPLPNEIVDLVLEPKVVFNTFTSDAKSLEVASSLRASLNSVIDNFKPDVIHCNDKQTYLPFRFDKNVFYSSHLMLSENFIKSGSKDFYFYDTKIERCAIENSAIVAVYSDFAAKNLLKISGGLCSPVVLPLGIKGENFFDNSVKYKNYSDLAFENKSNNIGEFKVAENPSCNFRKIRVSFFGRFENFQKGVNDFIYSVNSLGSHFKNKYNIEYSLYGKGCLDVGLDLSLFSNIDFLEGKSLYDAYKSSDIVVMPSRYESFGFTGLEAMASGCLLLVPTGLGMDMYAKPNWNCLEIPNDCDGIANVIYDAVTNLANYRLLRENAIRTAKEWTWKKSVLSHLYFYKMIKNQKVSQVSSGYRYESREIIKNYENISDVEKIHFCEQERICILKCIQEFAGKKILILSGGYNTVCENLPDNVTVISVLSVSESGVYVRPECLEFDDKSFDVVISVGAWEAVVEPCDALLEMQRVAKDEVIIFYHQGYPFFWQYFQIDADEDWKEISSSKWNCKVNDYRNFADSNDFFSMYKIVRYFSVENCQRLLKCDTI